MVKGINVSLGPEHVRIIERYGKRVGIRQFSTALQSLLHQFDQQQKAETTLQAVPEPTSEPAAA